MKLHNGIIKLLNINLLTFGADFVFLFFSFFIKCRMMIILVKISVTCITIVRIPKGKKMEKGKTTFCFIDMDFLHF